jgi:hypothetical protein
MTDYVAILDSQTDPESPIDTALMTALQKNLLAAFEGAANAPRMSVAAIQPGGSGVDGAFVDASDIASSGKFDFSSFTLTLDKEITASFAICRVFGNVSISTGKTLTVGKTANSSNLANYVPGLKTPGAGTASGNGRGCGGSSIGAAGAGGSGPACVPAAGMGAPTGLVRAFSLLPMVIGGDATDVNGGGSNGGWGRGVLVLIVHGNCTFTGATISASGVLGIGAERAGGGAGTIIVICNGTITDGTFNAVGGNANHSDGSAGGGGLVLLAAAAYAGTQVMNVAGGSFGVAGGAGYSEKITLTEAQINALMLGIK